MCTETLILYLSVFHFLNCFLVFPVTNLKIKCININVLKSLLFDQCVVTPLHLLVDSFVMKFEILAAMSDKIMTVPGCDAVQDDRKYQCFGGTCFIQLNFDLKMKIAGSSETLVLIQHYRRHSRNIAFSVFRYPLGNPPLIGVTWEGKREKCQPPNIFST